MLGLREFQDQKADIILKYDGGARYVGRAGYISCDAAEAAVDRVAQMRRAV